MRGGGGAGRGHAGLAAVRRRIVALPGVAGVAPYAQLQALAVRTPEMLPVSLRGIDPQAEATVTEVARSVTQGRLADLTPAVIG